MLCVCVFVRLPSLRAYLCECDICGFSFLYKCFFYFWIGDPKNVRFAFFPPSAGQCQRYCQEFQKLFIYMFYSKQHSTKHIPDNYIYNQSQIFNHYIFYSFIANNNNNYIMWTRLIILQFLILHTYNKKRQLAESHLTFFSDCVENCNKF